MTASRYVTGTHVASVERDPLRDGRDLDRTVRLAHAVARPVVDGLAESACGVLVTAIADLDWQMVWPVPRCPECARVVGSPLAQPPLRRASTSPATSTAPAARSTRAISRRE